jgi:acyl dehydratase
MDHRIRHEFGRRINKPLTWSADNTRMMSADLRYEEIEVGMTRSFPRSVSDADIDAFGKFSGDLSPLHTSDAYSAEQTQYRKRLVHGMLLASFTSGLIGMHLPGRRSVCLAQSFDFVEPVYAGDELEIKGEVIGKNDATRTLTIRTSILSQQKLCVKGKALVRVLDTEWNPEV